MNMTAILIAAAVIAVVGIIVGIGLGLFGEKFKVEVDEKEVAIREELPGNNCGGCGFAGCDALAKAIAEGKAPANACPVGGAPVGEKIAAILGVSAGAAEKKVAFVRCKGTCDKVKTLYNYEGIDDCAKASVVPAGGPKACSYGCTGFGSCVKACQFDAIHVVDGVAVVDKEKCVACGKCVETCPAGAVKMGQKLCRKDGSEVKYPHAPLPDNNIWGPYAWDEDYRDTARMSNTYASGSAPCKAACPAHVPVQAYLRLAHEGKYREALAMIKTENPFPAVCGRVCNKRCESECTRGKIDAPVSIDAVKKFVADLDLNAEDRFVPEKTVQSTHGAFDEKIAIIGGGPAGLSAAYYLAQMGYKPTVFEKNPIPGGMLTYGIPSYKLEKDVIAAEIDIIKELGAEIKCGVEVGKDITIAQLKEQGYKAFYIAIGCQGGRRPGVKNDDAPGTHIAVEYLRHCFEHREDTFDGSVVVIGGGNTAMDTARAAKRCDGVEHVYLVYRRTKRYMPADEHELVLAVEDGVEFRELLAPEKLENGQLICRVMKLGELDASGRAGIVETDETVAVPADRVIAAVGEKVPTDFYEANGLQVDDRGRVKVSPTLESSVENVYVIGDGLYGPSIVVKAMAQAITAAEAICGREISGSCDIAADPASIYATKGILAKPGDKPESERSLGCSTVCDNCVDV